MPLTVAQLKAFFTASGNKPEITNAQLTRLQTWLENATGIVSATPDDLADYIYEDLKEKTIARELGDAQDQVPEPTF